MTAKLPRCVARRIAYVDLEVDGLHATLANLKKRLERANDDKHIRGDQTAAEEIERLVAKRTQVTGRLDAMSRLRNDMHEWLSAAANRGMKLHEYDRKPPKLPKDTATLKDMIDRLRGEIGQLKAELDQVKRAPVKVEKLRKQVSAYVHALAKQGAPANITTENGQLRIEFTHMGAAVQPHKYLAWLFPQEMTNRLVEEIEERQALNGRRPMTIGEKEIQIEEIEAALEKAERKEIAFVDAAIEAEVPGIQHRVDVSIPVFLGVQPVKALARKAA